MGFVARIMRVILYEVLISLLVDCSFRVSTH